MNHAFVEYIAENENNAKLLIPIGDFEIELTIPKTEKGENTSGITIFKKGMDITEYMFKPNGQAELCVMPTGKNLLCICAQIFSILLSKGKI